MPDGGRDHGELPADGIRRDPTDAQASETTATNPAFQLLEAAPAQQAAHQDQGRDRSRCMTGVTRCRRNGLEPGG